MNIKTKYDLNQKVWFIRDNKLIENTIDCIEYKIFSDNSGEIRYRMLEFYNGNWVYYKENELFKTKKELIQSL